jgi:hypothetical protein
MGLQYTVQYGFAANINRRRRRVSTHVLLYVSAKGVVR